MGEKRQCCHFCSGKFVAETYLYFALFWAQWVFALGDGKQTDNDFVLHRTIYKSFYKSSNLFFAGLEYSIKSRFTKSKFVLFGDTLYLLKKVSTPNADYAAENETQLYTLNQIVHYA